MKPKIIFVLVITIAGDHLALFGPPNIQNDVKSDIIYPTEKPHSSGDTVVRDSFSCSSASTGDKTTETTSVGLSIDVTIPAKELPSKIEEEISQRMINMNDITEQDIRLLVKDVLNGRLQLSKARQIILNARDIIESERLKHKSNMTLIQREIKSNMTWLLDDAGFMEFVGFYRKTLINLENHYCRGAPSTKEEFVREIRKIDPYYETLDENTIFGGVHFRKWLWILNFCDENIFRRLPHLKNLLKKEPKNYVWFAEKAQKMFGYLSEKVQEGIEIMNPKFVDKSKIRVYLSNLEEDLEKAATIYFISQGWIKEEAPQI